MNFKFKLTRRAVGTEQKINNGIGEDFYYLETHHPGNYYIFIKITAR